MTTAKPETLPETAATQSRWGLAHEMHPGAVEAARQKTRRLVGRVALQTTVQINPVAAELEQSSSTLLGSLRAAVAGDCAAKESVRLNTATNVAEMLYKAGHQTRVELDIVAGKLMQGGKSLTDIQANSLRYSELNDLMRRRTEQELENAHTFEELLGGDVLDTHDAVVFSLSPDDAQTKQKYGFFTETETCSIQLIKKQRHDKLALETALVAGKSHSNAQRHDKAAIEALAARRGVTIELADAEDSLRQVVLVPKADLPNGVSDIVREYDAATKANVFYGQEIDASASRDYQEHAKECELKNKSFDSLVKKVTTQLLEEADTLLSPSAATKRLHKLTEQALVKAAITDSEIDERVFGDQAAMYITRARQETNSGNTEKMLELQQKAVETAVASACPMFFGGESKNSMTEYDPLLMLFGEDKYGSLAFRCPAKNCLNVRSTNQLIESCQGCGASVRC